MRDMGTVTIVECADCRGHYRPTTGGWECDTCGDLLGQSDLLLEADEIAVETFDASGASVLAYEIVPMGGE